MLIRAKSIIGLPVVEAAGLQRVGSVRDFLVDPDGGRILAILLGSGKVVSVNEIKDFFTDTVLIQSADSIVNHEEIARAQNILSRKIFLVGSKVLTSEGRKMGSLDDFMFDDLSYQLATIITKRFFSKEKRIISAGKIEKVLPKKIIISDSGVKVPSVDKDNIASYIASN